jgi:hypothetical protein
VVEPSKPSIALIFIAEKYGGWQEELLEDFSSLGFRALHLM